MWPAAPLPHPRHSECSRRSESRVGNRRGFLRLLSPVFAFVARLGALYLSPRDPRVSRPSGLFPSQTHTARAARTARTGAAGGAVCVCVGRIKSFSRYLFYVFSRAGGAPPLVHGWCTRDSTFSRSCSRLLAWLCAHGARKAQTSNLHNINFSSLSEAVSRVLLSVVSRIPHFS